MAGFFQSLADQQENKELQGKTVLKVTQLEDSVAQEERFLEYIGKHSLTDLFKSTE